MPASLNRFETNNTLPFLCLQNLQFGSTSRNQNEIPFRRATATIVRLGPATGSTTTAMTRFPSARRSAIYFGWLPAEITRAVPESLINTIASMVCHAHRMGRKKLTTTEAIRPRTDALASLASRPDERLAENDSAAFAFTASG